MVQLAWDAFRNVETLDIGAVRLSREDIIAFARAFDPQPFHIDEAAARETLLGGLAASGWHTCATVMGLLEQAMADHALRLEAGGTEEILWLQPVRPGDTLQAQARFAPASPCTCGSRARMASVDTINQRGETVMRWRMDCIFPDPRMSRTEEQQPCDLRRGRSPRVRRMPREHAIRYFDEIMPGDEITLGDYTFTSERVEEFKTRYSPGPERARDDVLSWHIPAAWMSCMVRHYEQEARWLTAASRPVPRLGPAAGVKHLRWHAPVKVGDTLTFRGWAERKIEVATQKQWGLLVVGAEGVDQAGKLVVSFYPQMLLERATTAS